MMSKKKILLSISALAATTVTAVAADMPVKAPRYVEQPPQVSGYVEAYGGWARDKFSVSGDELVGGSTSFSGWTLGGAGRGTYWWAPNSSIQLDAQAEGTNYKINIPLEPIYLRSSENSYLIGGHVNWRDPHTGLVGIFGGMGDAPSLFSGAGLGNARHGLIGGEGQVYWGPVTLYAQGGWDSTIGSISNFEIDSYDAWFLRGTARFYATPDFRLEGTVLYADGKFDLGSLLTSEVGPASLDFKTWLWRAKAEYKFAATPFAAFVSYEGSQTKYTISEFGTTGALKATDNRVLGGIRVYFNEGTLLANDRNGTTLDIISPLSAPSFGSPAIAGTPIIVAP